MNKYLLLIGFICLSFRLNAQDENSDIYLITHRAIAFWYECDQVKELKPLPPLDDNVFKVYLSNEGIKIEESSNHTMMIHCDSLMYDESSGEIIKATYQATCDGEPCAVEFFIDFSEKTFWLSVYYDRWILGYKLILLQDSNNYNFRIN